MHVDFTNGLFMNVLKSSSVLASHTKRGWRNEKEENNHTINGNGRVVSAKKQQNKFIFKHHRNHSTNI